MWLIKWKTLKIHENLIKLLAKCDHLIIFNEFLTPAGDIKIKIGRIVLTQ